MRNRLVLLSLLVLVGCSSSPKVTPSLTPSSSSSITPSVSPSHTPSIREKIVETMLEMSQIKWTPSETIEYYSDEKGKEFTKGKEYIGLPYTMGHGRTRCLEDPLEIFKSSLGDDNYTYIGPVGPDEYYGTDCSSSVEYSWRRNGLVTNAIYTGAMIPGSNSKISSVGDYDYSDTSKLTLSICTSNGKEVMFNSYSKLENGDALVKRVPEGSSYSGHVRLVSGIDVDRQTVTVIEQCGYGIDNQFKTTWRVNREYSFDSLFSYSYIPIRPSELNN